MKTFNIWEGIYSSFDEVPICGQGFESEQWLKSSEVFLLKRLESDTLSIPSDSTLSIVAAILGTTQVQLSCLDFGGGLGHHYLTLKGSLQQDIKLNYTVVEGPKSCEVARKHLSKYLELNFQDTLPNPLSINYDIVYSSSALQYIDNWQNLLQELLEYKPKYFILSDLVAGENKTFVTCQNYYESKIPYRFYNLKDVISYVTMFDYELIYQSDFLANILSQHTHIPMDNFAKDMQVGYAKNLIFARKL